MYGDIDATTRNGGIIKMHNIDKTTRKNRVSDLHYLFNLFFFFLVRNNNNL